MEARRLQTVDDLLTWPNDERVELIDGEIMKRPMARFEHGLVQSGLIEEISPFNRTCPRDETVIRSPTQSQMPRRRTKVISGNKVTQR